MQIVINISKKLYDRYKEKDHIKRCDIDEFEKALDRCIILSKGHGRLGDLDTLKVEMSNGIKAGLMIEGYENYSNINDVDDCLECVKYAPTIIEADEEKA